MRFRYIAVIFYYRTHEVSISHLYMRGMGCRSLLQSPTKVLPLHLLSCAQYFVIHDRDLSRVYSTTMLHPKMGSCVKTMRCPTQQDGQLLQAGFFNTLRPRQNGCRFADDTFKTHFLEKKIRISIKISLKFVPKGPINNNPALVQTMAWRRSGDKPLSEPMMVTLLTHICVTRPQWVDGRTFLYFTSLGPLLLTRFNINPSMDE